MWCCIPLVFPVVCGVFWRGSSPQLAGPFRGASALYAGHLPRPAFRPCGRPGARLQWLAARVGSEHGQDVKLQLWRSQGNRGAVVVFWPHLRRRSWDNIVSVDFSVWSHLLINLLLSCFLSKPLWISPGPCNRLAQLYMFYWSHSVKVLTWCLVQLALLWCGLGTCGLWAHVLNHLAHYPVLFTTA